MTYKLIKTDNYLLVVDDSVHPYDSSKLGNPLAYLPLNGSPLLEGVDLLPPIEDNVEDLAKDIYPQPNPYQVGLSIGADMKKEAFIVGYNKAREKYKYTKEDILSAIEFGFGLGKNFDDDNPSIGLGWLVFQKDNFIQYLHQYPTEFECEMVDFTVTKEVDYSITYSEHEPKPKTITTTQGVQWVGKYK
jgi:hypothetical protein